MSIDKNVMTYTTWTMHMLEYYWLLVRYDSAADSDDAWKHCHICQFSSEIYTIICECLCYYVVTCSFIFMSCSVSIIFNKKDKFKR